MPEWLLNKDNYTPPKDGDAFINKSILSILRMLLRLRLQTADKTKVGFINPRNKFVSTILVILLISLSKNFEFIFVVDALLIILVSMLDAKEIRQILKLVFLVLVFSFIILLPSMILGNWNSLLIIIKVMSTCLSLNILIFTTSWRDIVSSLKLLHMPDIFILVMDITMKYILILGEFSLNMLYSLKLRSVGKSSSKNTSLSGIMGTMFLKSKDMAEEMYSAMECRGFTGEYRAPEKYKFSVYDLIFVIINMVLVLLFLYFDRL